MFRTLRRSLLCTLGTAWLAVSCERPDDQAPSPDTSRPAGAVPSDRLARPGVARSAAAGEWIMAAGDYASTRFSPLDQITAANARALTLVWSFSTGILRGQEAAPLVVGSTMYLVTPYPNILYALDLAKPGARVKWRFEPAPSASAQGVARCDGVNEQILLDLPVGGRERRVLLRPERDGYMYVLDRETGEVLSADPFVRITSSPGVDLKSGRLLPNHEKQPRIGTVVRDICPAAPGAKDWQPSAFSPRTGLLYVPHQNLCMDWESAEANYIAGTPYVGANVKYRGAGGPSRGAFFAWDPVARRLRWTFDESFPVRSGAVVTAGDVAFCGTVEGWLKAVDAWTGALVWQYKTGSGIIGQPIAYLGPDGKQYVAILSGSGGWPGALVTADLDTRDSTAGHGWGSALPDLKGATTAAGTLYVFALP